ncbi:MAG: germination protein YpeB [Bacillota bacterium]
MANFKYTQRNIWLGLLGVALALVALWGYGQMLQKNRIMQRAESSYQRAFHQLIDHTVNIESDLAHLQVSMDRRQQIADLDRVRLHATSAREELAQLPLTTTRLAKTTAFFGSLMDTADALALKLLDNQPLNDQDRTKLKELHDSSLYARDELYTVSQVANSGRMRWMDAERLGAYDYTGAVKNPLVENLLRFDGGLKIDPKPASIQVYKAVTGTDVTAQQAADIAARFVGDLVQPGTLKPAREVAGDVPTFQLEGIAKGGQRLTIQVTRKGGHPLWMLAERIPAQRTLDQNQATARAEDFLKSRASTLDGTAQLTFTPVTYQESQNIALVNLTPKQDDLLLYPDAIRVKVALDNGEILGFQARDFLKNHTARQIPEPKLSEQAAVARANPSLQVQSVRKALILNDRDQEVLTWEVRGTLDNQAYQVYINAQDGTEERIEQAGGKL